MIPIVIVLSVLTPGATQTAYNEGGKAVSTTSGGITIGLFTATLLMIVFRKRYPRWWFDFALELARFGTRAWAYLEIGGGGRPPRHPLSARRRWLDASDPSPVSPPQPHQADEEQGIPTLDRQVRRRD